MHTLSDSLANNREYIPNPAVKFYEWKGSLNKLVYYDKEDKERKEVDKLELIILTLLHTVIGYYKPDKVGIYSNELYKLDRDFVVKTYGKYEDDKIVVAPTIIAEGIYSEIKDKIKVAGGKYCRSIYAYDINAKEIVNVRLSGSAISPFIEFSNNKKVFSDILRGAILQINNKGKQVKDGATVFTPPKFEMLRPSIEDEITMAKAANDLVIPYFSQFETNYENEEQLNIVPDGSLSLGETLDKVKESRPEPLPEIDLDEINIEGIPF